MDICDAERLACAPRARLDSVVDAAQFGVRRSVSIATLVLEVDTALQRAACGARPRGGGLFLDSSGALPSRAHSFLWAVLGRVRPCTGGSAGHRGALREQPPLVPMTGPGGARAHDSEWGAPGDRPLSPTLFALCTAPVIVLLGSHAASGDMLALCADDVAAVVDLLRVAPGLRAAFAEIAGSGLQLNVRTCVVLPLWPSWSDALRRLWHELVAGCGDVVFARVAKLLGFRVGSEAHVAQLTASTASASWPFGRRGPRHHILFGARSSGSSCSWPRGAGWDSE